MTMIWTDDFDDATYPDFSFANPKALMGIPLTLGHSLQGRFPSDVTLEQQSEIPPGDFFLVGSMRTISETLRQALEALQVNCEYFQVNMPAAISEPFYFANFLDTVDCFDRENSVYQARAGFATNISRVVLQSVDAEPSVYRVGQTIPVLLAVSEPASRKLLAAQFRGFTLVAPSNWTNPARIG